jgi:hypothetical protein
MSDEKVIPSGIVKDEVFIGKSRSWMVADDGQGHAVAVPADYILDVGGTVEQMQEKANELARAGVRYSGLVPMDAFQREKKRTGIDDGPELPRQRMRNVLVEGMVCGDPLNARRARARKETCEKPECGVALRQFRRAVVESRKCPACYHPSSPEEREDFKRWRKDRGQMQRRRGNPHGTKPKAVEELLEASLPHLQALKAIAEATDAIPILDMQLAMHADDRVKQLGSLINQLEKLFPKAGAQ